MGKPLELTAEEAAYFSLREDGLNSFKVPRAAPSKEENIQSSAAAKIFVQRVLDMIQERFGDTEKTILLAGHGSSGKTILRMLTKDPLRRFPGISNTGIWVVEQQDNGELKLALLND